jgi:hypothetical protein
MSKEINDGDNAFMVAAETLARVTASPTFCPMITRQALSPLFSSALRLPQFIIPNIQPSL